MEGARAVAGYVSTTILNFLLEQITLLKNGRIMEARSTQDELSYSHGYLESSGEKSNFFSGRTRRSCGKDNFIRSVQVYEEKLLLTNWKNSLISHLSFSLFPQEQKQKFGFLHREQEHQNTTHQLNKLIDSQKKLKP